MARSHRSSKGLRGRDCSGALPSRQHTTAPLPTAQRPPWHLLLWVGTLVFLTAAYFQNQKPEAHALSQFDLTRAIVERGTLSIDAYHKNTIDKAFFEGHYYCDKSPVNAFLGVPAFALYRWWTFRSHQAFDENEARYWTTCAVEGVAAALLAIMVAMALQRRGVPAVRSALAGALWIVATPLLGYSIHFYNYLPACCMLMGGYLVVESEWMHPGTPSTKRVFAAGLLVGLASWTLNTVALAALAMTIPLVVGGLTGSPSGAAWWRTWRRTWPWILGGLIGIAGYFVYTYHLFGSFSSPYEHEAGPMFREKMSQGLMGATWPRPLVAWLLTGHKFQGLLRWFPLTALALAGILWRLFCTREEALPAREARMESVVALLVFAGLLAYNSAYFMWWGGYAYAPRHLIPALPLLALGMVPWLRPARCIPTLLLSVAIASAVFNVTAVAVNPQPFPGLRTEQLMAPESVARWPSPYLGLQYRFWVLDAPARNWGHALGLHGRATMLPLAAIWAVAGLLLFFWREQRPIAHPRDKAEPRAHQESVAHHFEPRR